MRACFILAVLALPLFVAARNVDLSTVPKREGVELTIYNSEDITFVRETRTVTFRKGENPLQFSWANTLIDPTSVQLRFLTQPDLLEVLDTTFPHDKPQMLYWNVHSDIDGPATIEITYFTSGITWKADYLCVADAQETQLSVDGFVRVANNSGEEYAGARIRLVVGTINLVEKIAQLARVPMDEVAKFANLQKSELKAQATRSVLAREDKDEARSELGMKKEKQIIKEGLSEYFIYAIEGTETIPNGWSKRMRSFQGTAVPFKVAYRYRPVEYSDQLVRLYLLTNDAASKLGTTPLPDGVVRVFRENGRDGLSFLTQQHVKYVPVGDKIELNLGPDPSVVFELIKRRTFRDNIWMQIGGAAVLKRVDDGAAAIQVNSAVIGWDDHEIDAQRIRNYTASPIEVEIRRTWPGDVIFRTPLDATLFDYQTPELHATVPAGATVNLPFEVIHHQGHNAKQNHVVLEKQDVK